MLGVDRLDPLLVAADVAGHVAGDDGRHALARAVLWPSASGTV